jgi:hypothetical protein
MTHAYTKHFECAYCSHHFTVCLLYVCYYLPQQLPSSNKLPQVLALCCRLGGETGALCAQRALRTLVAAGGITTEACAAAVATTVGSLGWAALGEAVLAVVCSTQLANLDSAAALALKLCSLSPDKRCSGTGAAAATVATYSCGKELNASNAQLRYLAAVSHHAATNASQCCYASDYCCYY